MTTTESANPAESARRNIEAILPLLPLQKALYLRGVLSDDDPGFLQVQCRLHGDLDRRRLEAAWNDVVGSNAALRMSCRGRDDSDPMVIVWKAVSLPWTELDWRDADGDEQARRLDELLDRDRASGLEIAEAPVMRISLVRVGDDEYEMVWTCHHLFVDGWSAALVLQQVLERYAAASETANRSFPVSEDAYRRYFSWSAELDPSDSREYWRQRLGGFVPPGRLAIDEPSGAAAGQESFDREIDPDVVAAVLECASAQHLPLNALIQGAWALVLAALLERDDIVFGTTVAGRAAPVEGMDRLVGFFSNVVPVRATVTDDTTVGDWLRALRDEQFATQSHESSFLSDIHDWSGVAGGRPLFETLLVVENFPAAPATGAADAITLSHFRSGITTTFPLTLAIAIGEQWTGRCTYDIGRFGPAGVYSLLDAFQAALRRLARGAEQRVGDIRDDIVPLVPARRVVSTETTEQAPGLAPRDTLERRLVEIMEETLGIDGVGVRDDYFALGGTSILAVRLFDAIERRLAVRLPLATLLEDATVEYLATVIRKGAPSDWESLVPIQTGGSRRPLACVHAGALHVLFYRPLALALGPDQPVYGFEPVGRHGERAPLETFPEIAAVYVRELRQVQPSGPYRLLGYCFGGALCWEMAHQLETAGEEVELLALLDTPFPGDPTERTSRVRSIVRTEGIASLPRRAVARLRRRRARARSLAANAPDHIVASNWVAEACKLAFRAYEPPPLRATVTLVRSSGFANWRRADMHMRWSALAGGVDAHVIESRHPELLDEPGRSEIAELLQERL